MSEIDNALNTSMTQDEKTELLEEKSRLSNALAVHQHVSLLPFNISAAHINVPKMLNYPNGFSLSLGDTDCRYKKLIFAGINAAHHRYFTSNDYSEGRKRVFRDVKSFWPFVQSREITIHNRATILKDFESYRVTEHGVKTQSTGLRQIIWMFKDALDFTAFRKSLEGWEVEYLFGITEVSIAPSDELDAINLNNWFSSHTWLRRNDVGIGNELYARLNSPKALINSFKVTIETALIQIQLAKDALIAFLRDSRFTIAELPHLKVRGDFESANDYKIHIQATQRSFFNYLHLKLITNSNLTSELHLAIELIVHSNIHERHRANALRDVIDKKGLVVLKGAQNCFIGKRHSGFHLTFIKDLVEYIENPISAGYSVPVCEVEQLYFTWLMSCQTVQPSDIFKLTLSDFKFVRRVNGNITHIESDYFKGRANTYHQLNTLKTANDAGKAVLRYISDVTGMENKRTYLVPKLSTAYIVSGHGLIGWSVMLCANTSISTILEKKYLSQKITPVFIEAFGALINKGLTKRKSERRGMNNCETLVTRNFFGLASIKTSAVYAQSDTFDPTTLFNYNSHTDKTERLSYLTPHNEEWQNSCGKITRAVMRDLSVNLFRASQHDREIFNSEYSHAAELIKARSNEVLASMKIVTQKRDGRIDQLGILRNNHIEADLPDTIYLQDSPETVMKLKHYLDEVKSKQSMLKKSSPEFLLFTVLPTTEWIETLFEQKSFTKASLISGEALYVKYRAQLPPLFTAQLA